MKKILIIIFLLFSFLSFSSASADFAIYTGSGTWEHSITAFEKLLDWKGLTWEEISAWDLNHGALSGNYRGIFMPGGWAYNYKKSISSFGDQNIRDFISNGGAYIGMSAGAYYACDNVRWEGEDYPYYLNLFHGDCVGPIDEIAPWPNYVMTTMDINQEHEANIYEPSTEDVLYYGEPYFVPYSGQEMQTFASWNVPQNPLLDDKPGIVGFNYGEGRVLLVGPHPEIEEDSSRDGNSFGDELNDNGSDWPFLWTAVDWILRQNISEPSELPQGGNPSNDTIAPVINSHSVSPSIASAGQIVSFRANVTDNVAVRDVFVSVSEVSYPMILEYGPGRTIFYDNFESSSFNGWVTNAVSGANPWTLSTTNPFQSTRHLQSKPQSTNEPASIIERTINTEGFNSLTLSYQRRLVGLDAADEFKAKWFDGASWNLLEQTGSSSANDANYVLRTFTLPASANNKPNFKVRFECTAGAVSEFCRIDNFNLSSSSTQTGFYRYNLNTLGFAPENYTYVISARDFAGNQQIPEGGEFTIL